MVTLLDKKPTIEAAEKSLADPAATKQEEKKILKGIQKVMLSALQLSKHQYRLSL